MKIAFDPAKDAANIAKHGLSLADYTGWDDPPFMRIDDRFNYGETRWIALGRIEGRPHALIFVFRDGAMRLISFRRAHEKEIASHE